jgi:hypothetical protein
MGRRLAFSVLLELEDLTPLVPTVTWMIRVVVLFAFVLMVIVYGYALVTVYLNSPLFMCEWGMPKFRGVFIQEAPEVCVCV